RVALDALAGRPIVEDEVRRVHGDDGLDVLTVPRVVVALDRLAERGRGIGVAHSVDRTALRRSTRSSPTRRVMPSASKRSRRSCAGLRETPSRPRNRASAIVPALSTAQPRAAAAV